MTSLRIIDVVLIVMVSVLLGSGCTGTTGDGSNVSHVPSLILTSPSIPTPTQIESPQVPQEGYWIRIDPISDKYAGDIFTITATTNLSAGEEILVQVYSPTHFNGPKMQTREFYGATGTVIVIPGINGINTISFVVNSSTLYNSSPLKPDLYAVTADAVIQPVTGITLFNVNPRPVHHLGIWDLWSETA